MYFIRNRRILFDGHDEFSGVTFDFVPIFKENSDANIAIYRELWHRLRKDRKLKRALIKNDGPYLTDPGIIFFSGSKKTAICQASILVNNAFERNSPECNAAEELLSRTLRRMDKMLHHLIFNNTYDLALCRVARTMEIEPDIADAELKSLFKAFGREEGLFIDGNDVNYALAQKRSRRKKAYLDKFQS